MNFFSSDAFLEALARAHFPMRRTQPGYVQHGGRTYRVLFVDGEGPILRRPFLDFLEPTPSPQSSSAKAVRYIPAVSTDYVTTDQFRALPEGSFRASPTVDWSGYDTWDNYLELVKQRPGSAFGKTSQRKLRKAGRAFGADLEFRWHDPRPEALDLTFRWKSAQYVRTGLVDLFIRDENRRLFSELLERRTLIVSTMCAGERILATHLGALHDGRFYYWVPASDEESTRHSVGTALLEAMIQRSFEEGHREFDFLVGSEPYKWKFATHSRCVAPAGRRIFQDIIYKPVRKRVAQQLRRSDALYGLLRAAKRKLKGY